MNTQQTGSAIAEVSATLSTDFDLPALLVTIADHALSGLDAACAVVLLLDRREACGERGVHVIAEAVRDGAVADVDLHAAGPALVSASDGAITMVDDLSLADDTRWPEYRRRALAAGMRAVRAFPIVSLQVPLGSLVIHTHDAWGSSRSGTFGQILANLTAVALSSAAVDNRRVAVSDSIEALLDGSMVIGSATGMLAEVLGLPVDEARHALNRLARSKGASVTEYARMIMEAHDRDPSETEPSWARPAELPPPQQIGE